MEKINTADKDKNERRILIPFKNNHKNVVDEAFLSTFDQVLVKEIKESGKLLPDSIVELLSRQYEEIENRIIYK